MVLGLALVLGFVLGTILGSLALALADRSLNNTTFFGRSFCPHCKHKLAPSDLIPIISFLSLKGKCRYCHKKIKPEYPLVEVGMGLIGALILWQTLPMILLANDTNVLIGLLLPLFFKLFIATVLVIVAITDYKQTIIPDRITYPAIKIILAYLIIISAFQTWSFYQSVSQLAIGKFLVQQTDYMWRHAIYTFAPLYGGLIMALVVGLFFLTLILITRGRGMGGGDLKLGILIGLFFGYPLALVAILLSFLSGSLVAIALILLGKKHFGQTIPFGPFLSLGSIIALLWGEKLTQFYLSLSPNLSWPF
jgi:prepilin signal peptidase PulO-like enzyme (type II secretory pathway)